MNMKQINTLITETPAVEGEAPRALVLNRPTAPRFPIEAMPNLLKEVIHAIQATTQAPLALCSQSVLAAASLVAQAYINVEVLGGGIKPCILFCITIAESGERKTTVDNLALKAIKTHEEWLRLQYNLEFKNYTLEKETYDAQKKSILGDKRTKQYDKQQAMNQLGMAPQAPKQPFMVCEEPTIEALCKLFLIAQPALGIFTDEGGLFVGGYAMKDDNNLATITGLSKFWDGETVKRIRAGEGNSTIAGKRLAMHLMMQPMVAHTLFKNAMNRNQGFLARVLMMQPESTMGERLYKAPPPEAKTTIDTFNQYVLSILQTQPPKNMNHEDELDPHLLCLTPQAKVALIAYHDAVEVELGEAGHYMNFRDLGRN